MKIIDAIMRTAVTLASAAVLAVSSASSAHAVVKTINTKLSVVAQSTTDGTAHWISSVQAIDSACGNIMYMPYEDKEMFAVALSAQLGDKTAEIYYETAAGSVYFPGSGYSSPCRVVAINIKYYQP